MFTTSKYLPYILVCVVLVVPLSGAQQPTPAQQPAAQNQQPFTLQVSTQLVIETVTVRDRDGKIIEDLTAKDFAITEDGVPQTISVFQFQKLDAPAPAPAATPAAPTAPTVPAAPARQISGAEKRGEIKYQDRRLLVLYFDMSAMPQPDLYRAVYAAEKFIQTQMKPADVLAIMSFENGAVRVLQDFTDDRDKLIEIVDKLVAEPDPNEVIPADTGAAFGQDDAEFNLFNTDRQLSALQTAVRMLGSLSEQKSLIYFASGLRLNGINNQAQLNATINAAIRSNVMFYPIDARGLVARAPLGDATQASPGGIGMFNGMAARMGADRFQQSQDTLYALAADTGGKAMLDTNDLGAGIVAAQEALSSYYIIGYYTTNANLDGKFRRIKITLKEVAGAKLGPYREGYYAGKDYSKYTSADKERQLEEALMQGDPMTELTIALELNYFRLNAAEYFVPLTVKIPGRELALAKRRGADHTVIDFIGEVKDEYGTTIQNVRDKVDAKLTDATAAQLARSPIQYDGGFTLLPGKYVLKFLARDTETGRIGTFQTNFVVPNLNKEDKRVPISSVVLSSQKVDLRDAVFNAKKDQSVQNSSPLVENGQKLMPSVTRVFSKSRDIHVYVQAYQVKEPALPAVAAFVTLYKDQAKVLETPPVAVTADPTGKSKSFPFRFTFSPDKLEPGEYTCQVTVIDPNGQKASFWQAPIRVVP